MFNVVISRTIVIMKYCEDVVMKKESPMKTTDYGDAIKQKLGKFRTTTKFLKIFGSEIPKAVAHPWEYTVQFNSLQVSNDIRV